MLLSNILGLIQEQGAAASQDANPEGGSFMILFWIVILALFLWMLIIKPMKDQKKRQQQINSMEKGSKVVTSSGIYGRIREVKEKAFVIEIAEGVKITVDKSCVYPLNETEEKNSDKK